MKAQGSKSKLTKCAMYHLYVTSIKEVKKSKTDQDTFYRKKKSKGFWRAG